MCKHARAWTCRKAKAIGQKCEKPWENQGFAAERTGTELLESFPMILENSKGRSRRIADRRAGSSQSLENNTKPLDFGEFNSKDVLTLVDR